MMQPTSRDAVEFKQRFHAALGDYWHPLFGFDVTGFDDKVVKSGNMSMKDAVRQTYGQEAVVLIQRLLGIQS
jgi:hypothetical protein